MEAQLRLIEEKLDIIIAAMSANPEFSSFVKEGLLNTKIENAKKTFKHENNERLKAARRVFMDCAERSTKYQFFPPGPMRKDCYGFAANENAPLYAKESIAEFAKLAEQKGWDLKQIELDPFIDRLRFEEGFCPAFKIELQYRFGKELNLDEIIENIKKEAE